MEPYDLMYDNFLAFEEQLKQLFEPKGTKLEFYSRKGKSSTSDDLFKDDIQPDWGKPSVLEYCHMERKWQKDHLVEFIHFGPSCYESIWAQKTPHFKVAFDSNRALYLRDEHGFGTKQFPYERMYVRLKRKDYKLVNFSQSYGRAA